MFHILSTAEPEVIGNFLKSLLSAMTLFNLQSIELPLSITPPETAATAFGNSLSNFPGRFFDYPCISSFIKIVIPLRNGTNEDKKDKLGPWESDFVVFRIRCVMYTIYTRQLVFIVLIAVLLGLIEGCAPPLYSAARKGDLCAVRKCLEKGADLNETTWWYSGSTPLIGATVNGHTEVVKLLIDKGADVNAKIWSNETALMLAADKGHIKIVKLLMDAGADVNAKNCKGKTALMFAAEKGHTEIVKLLIDAGADVNPEVRETGLTALMLAASSGYTGIVKLLIDKGANVNAVLRKDAYDEISNHIIAQAGRTPLMLAAGKGYTEIVKLLIDAGADVNARDCRGETALIYGLSGLHASTLDKSILTAKLLINRGAKIPSDRALLAFPYEIGVRGRDKKRDSFWSEGKFYYQYLSPGFHSIEVIYWDEDEDPDYATRTITVGKPILLRFNAKAGHIYIVNCHLNYRSWNAWIEDLTALGTDMTGIGDIYDKYRQGKTEVSCSPCPLPLSSVLTAQGSMFFEIF